MMEVFLLTTATEYVYFHMKSLKSFECGRGSQSITTPVIKPFLNGIEMIICMDIEGWHKITAIGLNDAYQLYLFIHFKYH